MTDSTPTLAEIQHAAETIAPFAHRTPVLTSRLVDDWLGCEAFFKCENLQRAGAFKFRGACHVVMSLPAEQGARGVVTHSSGNHGAALALAAGLRGIPAFVVMPATSPRVKQEAVAGYGARIILCEPTLSAREQTAEQVLAQTGGEFVPPYNDVRIIAGQGTAALELHAEVPALDAVIVPVGGGGLAAGTALATRALGSRCVVCGGEPERADDALRSLQAGRIIPVEHPDTIADGLRTSLGDRTFPILQQHLDEIITVSEAAIIEAMQFIWTRMKLLIEPSSAVAVAAVRARSQKFSRRRVGIILSGGNVDLDHLPWSVV